MTNEAAPQVSVDLARPYEPIPEERAVLAAHFDRKKQRPRTPRVQLVARGERMEVSTDHPMPSRGVSLIMEALGTGDCIVFDGLLAQLIIIGIEGKKPGENGLAYPRSASARVYRNY
jgi:hypothetical protein